MKSVFHKLDTYRHARVEIPVFTGMTVFRAVLRIGIMNGIVIRRIISRSSLQRRLLKHPLETRHYGGAYFHANDILERPAGWI